MGAFCWIADARENTRLPCATSIDASGSLSHFCPPPRAHTYSRDKKPHRVPSRYTLASLKSHHFSLPRKQTRAQWASSIGMTAPPSSLPALLTAAIAPLAPTRSAVPARDHDLAPPTVAAPLRAPSLAATAMESTILLAP